MRWDAKVDCNHGDIVKALKAAYCSVLDLSRVGQGCPDILVGYRGWNVLMEIKRPKAKGQKEGKLELSQKIFLEEWRGPVVVVRSAEDALRAIGVNV
jgi:hypothetical protein